MNPAVSRLLCLRQGDQAIEKYFEEFCGLCHLVGFNDVALKDIFRVGLNEPIRSQLSGGKIHWTLKKYIDHALLLAGSHFTVGVMDEELHNPTEPTTPECFHVLAVMSGIHIMSAAPEPAPPKPAKPEPTSGSGSTPEPVQVRPTHKMAATPESPAKMAAMPKLCWCRARARTEGTDCQCVGPTADVVTSALSSPDILEVLPPSAVPSVMAVTILSVWAAHCTPEASSLHESAPEASPDHKSMPVPPEVVALAAEPPEEAASTTELPEVAASAAESPNRVVPVHELAASPLTAMEAVPELPLLLDPVLPDPLWWIPAWLCWSSIPLWGFLLLSALMTLMAPWSTCTAMASCFAWSAMAPCSCISLSATAPRSRPTSAPWFRPTLALGSRSTTGL
ncbi:hypothetical protein M9458_051353 [Cirrhinus mrigala]|uniref:Retrotransposon gag domain-containing protein n=1 Tax=Cirrhinus mrigala TaxID=683832 RepID=A0ABD0MX03_CIRMR